VIVLGLNRGNHEASACIVRDGRLEVAIAAERLSRVKHDGGHVWEAVRYCCRAAGTTHEKIDLVVQNAYMYDLEAHDRLSASRGRCNEEVDFLSQFPRVQTIGHHLAHAECGAALAPYQDAAVMVVDGIGQSLPDGLAEAESYYALKSGKLDCLHQRLGTLKRDGLGFHSFDSIGGAYSAVSSYLFGHWNRCGKVMGLAPYGGGHALGKDIFRVSGLDLECNLDFRHLLDQDAIKLANGWESVDQTLADVAWAIQEQTESALVQLATELHNRVQVPNLILTGGVALNCVANQRITDETPFERIFVTPAAGDDGIAIGCAFHGAHEAASRSFFFELAHPFYGVEYPASEMTAVLDAEVGISYQAPVNLLSIVAARIAEGKTVGWFQGASAMGPRALGNRSILADPRSPLMKAHLNDKVKHRESFRPFAGAVLAARASDYCEGDVERPYMTFAARMRPEFVEELPAIVHVDGTCRIQTVSRDHNQRFHDLIEAFGRQTGLPILLNTSFNRKDEPIVETPADALRCFMASDLDLLVLGDYLVQKQSPIPDIGQYRICIQRGLKLTQTRTSAGTPIYEVEWVRGSSQTVSAEAFQILSSPSDGPVGERSCLQELWELHCKGWIRFSTELELTGSSIPRASGMGVT
jgi:carbamoyltransferase